jgi:hypothetical protein
MTLDERTPAEGREHSSSGTRSHVEETTLRSEKLQIERKTFLFALKENPRGRFLRITEGLGPRRDAIIIPAPGLEQFLQVLESMVDEAEAAPSLTTSTASIG